MIFSRVAIRSLAKLSQTQTIRHSNHGVSRTILHRATTPSATFAVQRALSSNRSMSTVADISPNVDMFCRQCEQTRDHYACTTVGVCGKSAECAALQDTLTHLIKSVSTWAVEAYKVAPDDTILASVNSWTLSATFSTLTNVNFSDDRIAEFINEGIQHKKKLEQLVTQSSGAAPSSSIATLNLEGMSIDELEEYGSEVSIPKQLAESDVSEDVMSLKELATYGLKGTCAYATHCYQLGFTDTDIFKSIHDCYAITASSTSMDELLATVLKVGEVNAKVLAMLDDAHASKFGEPEITQVRTTAVKGKCILVSGHDMNDLYHLLQQTKDSGVNVYTHGEMLPAHSYPKLKEFPHLVGNYGTAWQNQKFEFAGFPGPVVVTTNCVLEPRRVYKNRLFTMNEVGVDGVQHVGSDRDFTQVINQAKKNKGFPRTIDPPKYHTVGFNHRQVLPLANQVIDAVQSGALSRIFVIGGCDGSQWERSYFTDLAEETPDDSLILTLGCAKNRIIHNNDLLDAKLANGMPRVMDMGQCNDSYSAVVVATELAKVLKCSVNDLPLSLAISHLEQKAAACLLTLLSLGIQNIRLGPSLPAYLTPGVLQVLSDKYQLKPTADPIEDLQNMMEGK